tara:strand:- start:10619 stop:11062 length:444 start_codon:yes stop_codon:yes gene_type:complete
MVNKKLSDKVIEELKEHSKAHKGGMRGKHMKNMLKFMKEGDTFKKAHTKSKKLDNKEDNTDYTYKEQFNKKYGFKKGTAHSATEIAKLAGIKYSNAKKIIKKGEGAYKSNPQSVRPNVKSATQWGYARLYSAVMGGAAAKTDKDLLK